ncbi:MAG: MBL fold metallo-hydrolase, partial [Planctomycetota bacterium]
GHTTDRKDGGIMSFPQPIDLGGVRVRLLDGGPLKLDGGAMFGIIPKPVWSRSTPADADNRIQLACNCLLVEWEGETARRALIETGRGAKYREKEQSFFDINPESWLLPSMRRAEIDPLTITDVVLTHLHFDHAGGLTRYDGERLAPTFPNARVHVQERELDDARANFGIMTATYRPQNFNAITDAGAWRPLSGAGEILPGIHTLPTPGHTRGHQTILVVGRDRTLAYTGDVMPTAAHVGAAYNMAYDLFPLDNRDSKRALLERAAREDWLLAFDHEPHTPIVRVRADGDWFGIEPRVDA